MKKGLLSILVAIIGFYLVYKYNVLLYEINDSLQTGTPIRFIFIDDLVSFRRLYKIVTISIALVSFYLGLIVYLKKIKLGIAGMTLAVLLCIAVWIPFWKYYRNNSVIAVTNYSETRTGL